LTVSRDDPRYPWNHRPADHNWVGLFVGGPEGEHNPLADLQAYTFCPITAATPENERKQLVMYRARNAERRGPTQRFAYVGAFVGARKPANSGRKRRAA
jgi:hypothetical protein